MDNKQFDFYQKLRLKIKRYAKDQITRDSRWFDYIMITPDFFHLLCKLAVENKIPLKKRLKLAAAIAYFLSPFDFLPEEIIGPAGYLDDIAVAAYVLNDLINEVDPQIIKKHWAGEQDVLLLIKNIIANANEMLGKKLWEKIQRKFSKQKSPSA